MVNQARSDVMDSLIFDNRYTRQLPADPDPDNSRRQVFGACYSRVKPARVLSPKLVIYSREVAGLLDLSKAFCESDSFTQIFSGNRLLPQMDAYASCYGGHQFGNWAGQLGDGRAINIGEMVNRRSNRLLLQLKGSGPTPYSRNADGWAVLRSSIREFLCSEAMHHLGVPTTRALSLILTGEQVERDMFYDGHPRMEQGAIVCRVAPSFTRFGNFEIFAFRNEIKVLKKLLDYTMQTDFQFQEEPCADDYIDWFNQVCQLTAQMVVHWMRVGFVHGVMNTDNMSILGLTIDYGPYGWLEDYSPDWTPNTTDAAGKRYCFGNQPGIAHWNLNKLANAIYPLIGETDPLEQALEQYVHMFQREWNIMMAKKLGLSAYEPETDKELIKELLSLLSLVETDYTIFFRNLAKIDIQGNKFKVKTFSLAQSPLYKAYYLPEQITPAYQTRFLSWLTAYGSRVAKDKPSRKKRADLMNEVNPKYVLRNYLAQLSIDKAEQGDFSMIEELLSLLRHPYDDQPEMEAYAQRRPDWARHKPGCSMLSCSS